MTGILPGYKMCLLLLLLSKSNNKRKWLFDILKFHHALLYLLKLFTHYQITVISIHCTININICQHENYSDYPLNQIPSKTEIRKWTKIWLTSVKRIIIFFLFNIIVPTVSGHFFLLQIPRILRHSPISKIIILDNKSLFRI